MSVPRNRLMVMAGGTGGHVFPALAVANVLRQSGTQVTWLGTRAGLEARVVPANEIEMHWISIEGLRGKGPLSWLKAPFKLLAAVVQSRKALREFEPDCVLGMGGFVAGPGGLAARLSGTPLIVHEQNAVAGLTNRVLAKMAQRVLTGFPNVAGLPADAEWVGNPVRQEIKASTRPLETDRPLRVLIIGGSQGAHSFNIYLPAILSKLDFPLEIIHQSGRDRKEAVDKLYAELAGKAEVAEFIEDMASAYEWADVLICRAGAMTIAECCAAAKPAILIPFPHSAGDHQRLNAQMMVDAGGAWLVDNEVLALPDAGNHFSAMLSDAKRLREMGKAATTFHKPDALSRLVDACEEYLHA